MDAESFRESRDELDRPFVVIVQDVWPVSVHRQTLVSCISVDNADSVSIEEDTAGFAVETRGPDGKPIDGTGWAWLELPAQLRYSV